MTPLEREIVELKKSAMSPIEKELTELGLTLKDSPEVTQNLALLVGKVSWAALINQCLDRKREVEGFIGLIARQNLRLQQLERSVEDIEKRGKAAFTKARDRRTLLQNQITEMKQNDKV